MKDGLVLINRWEDIGIIRRGGANQEKVKCPNCTPTRKNKSDKSLSVNYGMGVANCHNCYTTYKVKDQKDPSFETAQDWKYPAFKQLDLSENTFKFFESRGIKPEVLQRYKVSDANEWMPGKEGVFNGKPFSIKPGVCPSIAFNYYLDDQHINTKFRASQKRFRLVSGAKLAFYGIDFIGKWDWCAIQEGEIDTLSAYQCGVYPSISVPNGAALGTQKLEYLDNCIDYFHNKKKIVIATDGDSAGRALAAELIRRLGAERCWGIEYPEGCKDTNEVLLKYGERAVKEMYDNAKPVPIEGIASSEEVSISAMDLYDNGFPATCKIGYPNFDELMSYKPGEVTTITGIPSMGKSTFLDQVTVKLSARFGWKTVYFSPENDVPVHTHNLIRKLMVKPTRGENRLSREQMLEGLKFINEYFFFMQFNEMNTDVDGILAKTREMIARKGVNALVIDPWNCIDHQIPRGMNEGQYISTVMSKLTSFAKINQIHIFLVAHPTKMDQGADGKYLVPTLYKISGSAHFFNKTYNGMTVHVVDFEQGLVEVHVQKVKFEYVGKKGLARFKYDVSTGTYREESFGDKIDIEYAMYQARLKKELGEQYEGHQEEIPFQADPAKMPEPRQLTDINKMNIGNSFEIPENVSEPPF